MKTLLGCLILILIAIPFKITSQNENKIYKCTVYDEKSRKPLEGTTLKEVGSTSVKITDNKGVCYFLKSERFIIEVSFIGYETQSRTINPADYKNNSKDTISLNFYLKSSTQAIKPIEIYENKKHGLLPSNQWLYDYELLDNKLWILTYGNKKNKLIAIDSIGDTIQSVKVPVEIIKLDKAYGKFLMALSNDSAYRVEAKNNTIKFSEQFNITKYNSQIVPAIIFNEFAIRKEANVMNASILYRMINLNSRKSFVLSEYADAEKANYNNVQTAMNNAEEEYLTEINKNWMGDIEPKDLPAISQLHQSQWDLSFYHLKELSTYLRIARDSIYIFNHEIDSIYVFDKHGNYNRTFSLSYHIKNVHFPEIIVDEEHQDVYYKYVNKDVCYLTEINLNTGKPGRQCKIKETFPQKIKIRSGIIYFMHNTKGPEENNNLYLQKM